MTKDLQEKAIDFKGQKYVLVKDRVNYFNEQYPTGSITTELLSDTDADRVVVKATVTPKAGEPQTFTGLSQALWGDGFVNKTSAIENCETSAVGRALAFMGIGVIDSIASIDEINKAQATTPTLRQDPELTEIKKQINAKLIEKGIEDYGEYFKEVAGTDKITNVAVAKVVLRKLNEG